MAQIHEGTLNVNILYYLNNYLYIKSQDKKRHIYK